MSEMVVPADKAYRKKTLILAAAIIVIGALAIYGIQEYTGSLFRADPKLAMAKVRSLLIILLKAGGIFLAVFGAYIIYLGNKIRGAGRFPPPGMKVIRDTRVQTGNAARVKAAGAVAVGLFLMLCSILFFWYFPHEILRLFS